MIRFKFALTLSLFVGSLLFCIPAQADLGVWDSKMHIVYHLSEPHKAEFVLGNIRNHLKGGGGPENLDIVLVVHGAALEEFDRYSASEKVRERVPQLKGQGVKMVACGNTMKRFKLKGADLVDDFEIATEGGVTRIAQLQSRGYLYLRP